MNTCLTLDDINQTIVKADYYHFPDTTTTVCCLTLRDGFTVIGYSACVDPANFDAAKGRSIAHDDAIRQVWQLEGYLLNWKLKRGIQVEEQAAADAAELAAAKAEAEAAAAHIRAAQDKLDADARAAAALQDPPPAPAPAPAPDPELKPAPVPDPAPAAPTADAGAASQT